MVKVGENLFYNNCLYTDDIKDSMLTGAFSLGLLRGCSVLITGASGLIGSFLVDALLLCNDLGSLNLEVYAMSRNRVSLEKRFRSHLQNPHLHILEHDVSLPLDCSYSFDYIVHAASNAYPRLYSTDPVGTIMGNVWGAYNLLQYGKKCGSRRLLSVSSGEVYGQGSKGISSFDESYSGYVDSTNPRSCYPNGKRAAETLCVSFTKQYTLDTVIARPCHIYGPTMTANDNRVSAQFVNNALAGTDIVMKSQGLQLRSYCYVADCVSAIMTILLRGETANAYNISNPNSVVTIREMAEIVAGISGTKVVFEQLDGDEKGERNPVRRSVLKSDKLESLGWKAEYDMREGMQRTLKIIQEIRLHR